MKKMYLERFFLLPKIVKQCQNHNCNQDHVPRNPALRKIKKAFSIFNLPWESFLCQLPNFKNLPFAFMGKKKIQGCLCSQGQFTLPFYKSVNRPEKLALSTVQKENVRMQSVCQGCLEVLEEECG